ncbi:efflux RND transporter periplasmic adaptor subunit [Mariniradius sediminis]|uniref:Efflux RND transporter periplasmic adaptor subunit n=1 Tax=Mariniradius sediminis TaxID=2909237 RepID=A0ABS9C080_9BACT|nr:efflux RND transporter periplasmic adaptor subunit [Mariniradius sediminis]MCF1752929.1 efflux RND transporter periplasmic adaptor subunit [Mariniradius sediminis]
MKKRHLIPMRQVKVLILVAVMLPWTACKKTEVVELPPVQINAVKAIQQDVPIFEEFVAQVYGESDVDIRSRVDGWVTSLNFREGTFVKKGTLLYTIDDIQYQTSVDREKSQVASAQTELVRAQNELSRVRPLAEMNALSKQDLDNAVASYEAAASRVRAAEASLANSKIELGYTRVYAPFDGIIGISNFRVGDYVTRMGTTSVLATISSVGAVRVRFQISEKEYLRLSRLTKEEIEQTRKNVHLVLADGTEYEGVGEINLADREIDPKTGTLTVEARFPNPTGVLRPGLFVKARILVTTIPNAVLVPQRAVIQQQHLSQVFTINASGGIQAVPVTTGPKSGDGWVINSGVKAGDLVAILGTASLTPDTKITVNEQAWPEKAPAK